MQKVAIVGCGLITTRKFIPIFLKLKRQATIVGICDLNETVLNQVGAKFGISNIYTDFSHMLMQQRPDIVVVCTPPAAHTRLVIEALEKGSHVLVEKPMALTSVDCQEMIEASKKSGMKLGVMHNQLFNPAFDRACDLVASGAIGRFVGMRVFLMSSVHDMTTNESHWAHKLPAGVLSETGPHAVYLSLAFLNKVTDVHVRSMKLLSDYPWSVTEDARFDLIADNGISSIMLMYASNQSAAEVEIIGTTGMLKVDLQSRILVNHNRLVGDELLSAKALTKSVISGLYQTATAYAVNGIKHSLLRTLDGHYVGITRFLEAITKNVEYRSTGEKGKATIAIMEIIVEKLKAAKRSASGQSQ